MGVIIMPVSGHRKCVSGVGVGWCVSMAVALGLGTGRPGLAAEPAAAVAAQDDIETGVRVAQILKDAQQKREAGQIAEALADLRVANALIKKAKGAGHPDTLPVLDMAGALLLENGQIAEAQTPLGKAVAMREEMVAEGKTVPPAELASALAMLARAEMLSGKHEQAGEGLKKAVGLLESSVGAGHESTLAVMEQLANVHVALGDPAAGEAVLEQVLQRRRKRGAVAAGSVLPTAASLAMIRAWSGQAVAAIDPLASAIADHERARLDKSLVPPALRQLANLHAETGDDGAARQAIDRALAIDRAAFGDDHAAVIIDRLALLRLDAAADGAESVAAGCDPLVARLQQLAGLGDPQAAAGLRATADLWLAAQEFGRASELYRQALELDKRLVGDDHADVVADEVGLGRCLLGNGDAAAALPLFEHALALSKRLRGPRHAETLAVMAAVGDCAARVGDRTKAETQLQAVIEAGVPRRSDADESLLCGLVDGVAALQERAGDPDRAMETRFSIVALRQRQFGEQHARVADIIVRLANARQAAGEPADAVALYERAVAMLEAVHGPDHPEVAAVLAALAVSFRSLGANEQAEQALARGLAIWEKTVGPDHPVTIATIKPLALVRLALKKDGEALPLMERLLAAYDADPTTPPADRLKLLKKLAQIYEARGDTDRARATLERVVEAEAALGKAAGSPAGEDAGNDTAVDTSKLKRMLSVDEQAEANLAKARGIASSLEAAQQRLAKVDPHGSGQPVARAADRAVGGQAPTVSPGAKPSDSPVAAAVIAAALARHRAGQHDEAVDMLRTAIDTIERAGNDATSPQRAELADLLIALADQRPQVLEWTESVQLYSRAVTVAAAAVGDDHPTSLVAAVRLASAFRAKGDTKGAKDLDDLLASKVAAASEKANAQQRESIREALRGGATVAAASGDRGATVRCLDMLLQAGTDLDDRSLLFALDGLARLLPTGTDDPAAAAVSSRCLQLGKRAAGARPVLVGIVQHHLGLAEARAGKLPAAAAILQKAADVDRQTLGRSHPRVAYHLLELASIRSRQGDENAAAALLTEVQDIESGAERVTADMAADLRRLALVHRERGEFEAAAKVLTAALTALEKSPDRSPLEIADIAEQSARLSLARGQSQRARDLFAEAAAIVQSAYGAGHPAAVAAMLRRERADQPRQQQRPKSAVAAGSGGGAKPADPEAAKDTGSSFAALLAKKEAEAASARRTPRPEDGSMKSAATSVGGDDDREPADEETDVPVVPRGGYARRPLGSVTQLAGSGLNQPKMPGSRRSKALDSIAAYASTVENRSEGAEAAGAGGPAARSPAAEADADGPRSGVPARQPAARQAADLQAAHPAEQPRPSPFVAASRSGLRQRTALARERALKVPVKASTTVDDRMLAAWSAHELGSRSEAITACEEALAQATRESGDASETVADVLDQFASIAIAQGNLVRGKQLLERLGSTRWKQLGPADPQVADAAARLAELLAHCGEYERALPLANRAAAARAKAAATRPAAAAESLLLVGKIELGRGDPASAAARVEQARPLLATAESSGRDAADGSTLPAARLALVRLLVDLGDFEAASVEADRLVSDVTGDRPVTRPMAEEILLAAARAHRFSGDAAGAAVIAGRLVGMADTPPRAAVFLVELALAQRAARDSRWDAAAIESGRVLVPAVRRLSPAATDVAATDAVAELAAVWLETGKIDRADEAIAAASIAAASLPPAHPVAARIGRLAARAALNDGDEAKALDVLATTQSSGRRGVRPVAGDRQRAFLARVTDAAGVEAVLRHQHDSATVSGPPAR